LVETNERSQNVPEYHVEHSLDSFEYLEQLVNERREGRRIDVRECFDHDIDWA